MSSEKYRAGILAGIASSRTPGTWPETVPGLGEFRGGQPLGRCIACAPDEHAAKATTWVTYGGHPLCKGCSLTLAAGGEARLPFVTEALKRAIASRSEESRGVPRMRAEIDGPCAGTGRLISQPQPRLP